MQTDIYTFFDNHISTAWGIVVGVDFCVEWKRRAHRKALRRARRARIARRGWA